MRFAQQIQGKRKRADYLIEFFDEAEDEDRLLQRFEKRCID
jgi:hypothetical protein